MRATVSGVTAVVHVHLLIDRRLHVDRMRAAHHEPPSIDLCELRGTAIFSPGFSAAIIMH